MEVFGCQIPGWKLPGARETSTERASMEREATELADSFISNCTSQQCSLAQQQLHIRSLLARPTAQKSHYRFYLRARYEEAVNSTPAKMHSLTLRNTTPNVSRCHSSSNFKPECSGRRTPTPVPILVQTRRLRICLLRVHGPAAAWRASRVRGVIAPCGTHLRTTSGQSHDTL